MKRTKFSTRAIHAGQKPDPLSGAVMTPVYLTSTYVQQEIGKHSGYEYSRVNNPTRDALEANIASLENGRHGMAFGSGMAAIDAIFRLLKPGDHALVSDNVYGGTYRIARMVLEEYGLNFDFVNTTNLDLVRKAFRKNTQMIFVETPTNPTMEISDLSALAKLGKSHNVLTVADNTFASPYLQRPIDHGFDIVQRQCSLPYQRRIESMVFVRHNVSEGDHVGPRQLWVALFDVSRKLVGVLTDN